MRDIDWVAPRDGYIYFAKSEQLLDEVFRRAKASGMPMKQVANVLAGSTLADLVKMKWLTPADFGQDHPLLSNTAARQSGHGQHPRADQGRIRKSVFAGSSLKGALRTSAGRGSSRQGQAGSETT